MDGSALRQQYESYIRCLNERQFTRLDSYVAAHLSYNGVEYTIDRYRNMLIGDTTAIPDLYFEIALLVVQSDHVAARIDFRCTPQRDFLGFRPNGKPVTFSENVFYRFENGKIIDVWSLIDRYAIEQQLGSASRLLSFPASAD